MHMHSAVDMIYPLILLLHITDGAEINTLNIGVKSGSPGIIPCVYNEQYKEKRKYWCQGSPWHSCRILAYANETSEGNYYLTDYPNQSIFTVQWENLQTSDSGRYWCAVEIVGKIDDGYHLYLTVRSDPAVSVVSSSVSGHEGGDISVQCLYSSEYQKKPKQWCKIKDQSCYTVERTDTSQNSSVHITDDVWKSSFTVLMTGLRLTDSGWYCCSVGDLQVPVQLTVTKPKRALTVIQSATPSDSKTDMHTNRNPTSINKISNAITTESKPETDMHDVILVMFLPAMLVLFVILVAIVRLRKKPERGQTGEEEHLNSTRNAMPCENQMTSNSPADATSSASVDEGSVIYSAVIAFHKAPSTSVNSEGDVIYSAVNKTPTRRVTSAPSE